MIKSIRKFFSLSSDVKWMMVEAFGLSIYYEICLRTNWSAKIMKVQDNRTERDEHQGNTANLLYKINRVIKILEKKAPWKPMCYNRALTAKRMLRSRDVETTMLIGFRKKDGKFDGHAWLTFNNKIVTGYIKGIQEFQVLKSNKPAMQRRFTN